MNKILSTIGLLCISTTPVLSASPSIDLTGKGYVTYGDANSYSLPLSGLEVLAGPGQISMYTKLGLQAIGVTDNIPANMDDAFVTPSANTTDGFRMDTANEPNEVSGVLDGLWDRDGWWDTSLDALNSNIALASNSLVFFFANNETGGEANDNLAAWARFELTQISTGASLGMFDLTNDVDHDGEGYGPPPAGGGVPLGDPANYTSNGAEPFVSDFLMSGGNVCVTNFGNLVDCTTPILAPGEVIVLDEEHNLGGDRAAYAIVLPELDALIADLLNGGATLSDYALHVDYRLGCGPETTFNSSTTSFPTIDQGSNTLCDPNYALNGGAEKVFIGSQWRQDIPPPVPEPSTLVLMGLALLGIGYQQRNRM